MADRSRSPVPKNVAPPDNRMPGAHTTQRQAPLLPLAFRAFRAQVHAPRPPLPMGKAGVPQPPPSWLGTVWSSETKISFSSSTRAATLSPEPVFGYAVSRRHSASILSGISAVRFSHFHDRSGPSGLHSTHLSQAEGGHPAALVTRPRFSRRST